MIRDPSDGSVRAPKKPAPDNLSSLPSGESDPTVTPDYSGAGPVIDPTTSGLPSASARDAERHQRSKQWLADYRAGKINPKPEGE